MRILQINAVNRISSTGRNISEMNAFLRKAGHTCAVAYSAGPSEFPEFEYRIGSKTDEKLHGLFSRLSGKQGYFSKSATRKLLAFTDEFAPDVVALNNLHANYIHLPMLLHYLAEKDIATVAVLHDCWFFTGKCCYYTALHCDHWQKACGNCPGLKADNISWFFDKTPEMLADKKRLFGAIPRLAVVGVSDWITSEAKKSPVFQDVGVIERIYNWIDTETFAPHDTTTFRQELNLQDKKVLLCVSSVWSIRKGIDTLLKIADRISDDKRLLLVGKNGDQQITHPRILSIPQTNNAQELADYYAMADVFVQPSLEETFGKVTAEALSCGTPVVCFDTTATPELVGEGCGAVVSLGDVDTMLEKIHEVLNNGKDVYEKACRNFALQNFGLENNLSQYLQLFEKLCYSN